MKPKYQVGTQFKPVGKDYICTIEDILTTTNMSGQVDRIEYRSFYFYCGQRMLRSDIDATVARGIDNLKKG